MTSPYASADKIAAALGVIQQQYVGETTVPLLRQIAIALANRSSVGGDPLQNTYVALGNCPLGNSEETLLKQIFVLAATT